MRTRRAGRWTPAELGVRPVAGGGPLPGYVRRPHDELLRRMLDPAVADSRLIVIRGDSCAGKTRAAYEAVLDRVPDWRLEYPPGAAALAGRLTAGIPARTVLWLGELRRYAEDAAGAAALTLLADLRGGEGHLVITTIWPEDLDAYVTAAGARRGAGDPARAAGRLLARLDELAFFYEPDPAYGGVIDVPDRFTGEDLAAAAGSGDPVLAAAAASAPDGQVTQYLAGARELLDRHAGLSDGDPARRHGQAVIAAAMDATRFGHAPPLPAGLLREAAAGYLAGQGPEESSASGFRAGLEWACAEAGAEAGAGGGVRALEPVPPAWEPGWSGYRVAGYLDQHARRTRSDQASPAALWDALGACAIGAGNLTRLGQAARDRGRYRHAAVLWARAVTLGGTDAAGRLIAHLGEVSPGAAADAAAWAAARVGLEDPWDLARLLDALRAAQAGAAIRALVDRDLAGQVRLDHRWDVVELLRSLHAAGAGDAVDALAGRLVAVFGLDSLPAVASLLVALHGVGASDAIRALVARDPASHADLEEPEEAAVLLEALHAAGAGEAARALAASAAVNVGLGRPQVLARLLKALRTTGDDDALRTLMARDPVGHGDFEDPWEAAALLAELRAAGADDAIRALLERDPARLGRLDFSDSVAWLLRELHAAGAGAAIATLLGRDPAGHADLSDLGAVPTLLEALRAAGDVEAVRTLATRVADLIAELDDAEWLAELLDRFRVTGGGEAVRILLDRDPAGRACLDRPEHVAWLLDELRAAQAGDQVRTLLARDPAGQADVRDPREVAALLKALRAAGAGRAAGALAARAAQGASLEDPGAVAWLAGELHASGPRSALRVLLARDPAGQVSLAAGRERGTARLAAALRAAGARRAARALEVRAADAGMFGVFLRAEPDQAASYRFGREPDGAPAPPWGWEQVLPGPGAAGSGPATALPSAGAVVLCADAYGQPRPDGRGCL